MALDILSFVRKWNASTLTERSGAPQHFRDLCEVLGVPHPTEEDEVGASYTYEKRVSKTGGGEGFADVWKRGYFAWEYKSKGGDLKAAYKQINEYHEALENPPLLVVCDFVRFEVHTKFENRPSRVFAFTLDDLLHNRDTATSALPALEVLRYVFGDFNQLRHEHTAPRVTSATARDFLRLAEKLEIERRPEDLQHTKLEIAHFLMRLVFCLFADSIELLPNHTFRQLVRNDRFSPINFNRKLPALFEAMSQRDGFFGPETIRYFNGGLFKDSATIHLDQAALGILHSAAEHDWSAIEPAIFGTLFERSLDSAKRSMIGAHYTSPEDILLLVEPVVMTPLRRRWAAVQQEVLAALAAEQEVEQEGGSRDEGGSSGLQAAETDAISKGASAPESTVSERLEGAGLQRFEGYGLQPAEGYGLQPVRTAPTKKRALAPEGNTSATLKAASRKPAKRIAPALQLNRPALLLLQDWAVELSSVRILDPACGSGNFLYMSLKSLLDLWHEARTFGIAHGLTLSLDPIPNPAQLFGIEIDFYAHEIASIVVWIGFLQWQREHGIVDEHVPLLRELTNIQHADAILRYDETQKSEEFPNGKPYEPEWPEAEYIISNPPFLGGTQMRKQLGDEYCDDLRLLYEGRVRGAADFVAYWFEKSRKECAKEQKLRVGLLSTQGIRGGANQLTLRRVLDTATIFWALSERKWALDGATVHISMTAFTRGDVEGVYLDGRSVTKISAALTSGVDTTVAGALRENENICFEGTKKHGAFDIPYAIAQKMLYAPLNPNGRPNSDVVTPWVNALDITRRPRNMYIVDFGTSMSMQEAALYEYPFQYVKEHVYPERQSNRREARKARWWLHGETNPGMRAVLKGRARFVGTPRVSKHRLFVWLPAGTLPDSATCVFARSDDYFLGVLQSVVHEGWSIRMGTQLDDRPRYTPSSTFDTFPFPWPPGKEPAESEDPRVQAIADAARELVRLRDAWLNPPGASEADLKDRTLTKLYNARPEWLANAHRTLDEAVFAAYNWPPTLTDQEILARLLALNHERASVS